MIDRALALTDIVKAMFDRINGLQLPGPMRIYLTKQLADLEYRLTTGCSDIVQLSSLVGIFLTARALIKEPSNRVQIK